MQNTSALPNLAEILQDISEHVMVRHEPPRQWVRSVTIDAVDAGEISMHEVDEITESCQVALDLLDHCLKDDDLKDG